MMELLKMMVRLCGMVENVENGGAEKHATKKELKKEHRNEQEGGGDEKIERIIISNS
jgi:hypothetical protein